MKNIYIWLSGLFMGAVLPIAIYSPKPWTAATFGIFSLVYLVWSQEK